MSGEHISVINEMNSSLIHQTGSEKRILIIDDDMDILEGYKFIFECEGFEPTIACTPGDALRLAEKEQFGTILLDYMLPDMTGDELAEMLHEINPSVKLVIISGYNNVNEAFRARNIEIAGIIRKPVHPEALLNLMNGIVSI